MSVATVVKGPAKQMARRLRSHWRHLRRTFEPATTHDQLVEQLRSAAIAEGDVVMVHSSLARLGNVEGGADTIVHALLATVGPGGTVLMPAYGRADDVIERQLTGHVVDLRSEKGHNGAICEALRKLPGTRRSSHPFSSVCAHGRLAEWIVSGHADAPQICHPSSPIARLVQAGGKVVGLGTTMGPVSFYHVIEDTWDKFPVATYSTPFTVRYVDADGEMVEREIMKYNPERTLRRRIDQPEAAWIRERMTRYLDQYGLRRQFRIGHGKGWVVEGKPFYDALTALAQKGITIYTTREDWQAMGRPEFPEPLSPVSA